MISSKILRWYILITTVGILYGLLAKPVAHSFSSEDTAGDWAPPEYARKQYDASVSRELSDMAWWKQAKGSSSFSDKESDGGITVKKVSWIFRGVIADSGKHFALIAEDANSPLKRYLTGEKLPGGEVLEEIDRQNILFSLSGDEKGKNLERKLYAPAEH